MSESTVPQTREIKARYLTAGMTVLIGDAPFTVSVVHRYAGDTVLAYFDRVPSATSYGVEEGVTVVDTQPVDQSHTTSDTRNTPGVYHTAQSGHVLLVGRNARSLCVLDLGGMVHVGGIEVADPDHLDEFGRRLCQLAGELRTRNAGSTW